MTTVDLYKQLKEGKITESKFLYEVRRDNNLPFITNLTSFKDAEQMLKNKSIIQEWAKDDKEVVAIIDKLNPYRFKRAMYAELNKLGDRNFDEPTYIKIREKVARKMAADPMAYREEEFMNSKDIEKQDAKRQMEPVSKGLKHEGQPMTKIKGQETLKGQRAPKTENKKGKPKGVKELTYHAKKAKGITEIMPETKKEKIVESLFSNLFKKKVKLTEDTHHRFGIGQSVPLPEKDRKAFGCESGTVKDIKGGTLYLELEVTDQQGQPLQISRQINVIEHEMGGRVEEHKEAIKEPVFNNQGHSFKTGEEVKDERGNKVRIDGFKKDKYGKIEALIKASTGMFYQGVNVDGLTPIKSEVEEVKEPKVKKEDKLKELFNKLKEVSKKNLGESKKKRKTIEEDENQPQPGVPEVSVDDKITQQKLKQQKKPFITYKQ